MCRSTGRLGAYCGRLLIADTIKLQANRAMEERLRQESPIDPSADAE